MGTQRAPILPQGASLGQLAASESRRALLGRVERDVASIVASLQDTLVALGDAMARRGELVAQHRDVLPSGARKGEAFLAIEVDLALNAPQLGPDGKRITADQREAWVFAEARKSPEWQALRQRLDAAQAEISRADMDVELHGRRFQALLALLQFYEACLGLFKAS